MHSSLFYMVIFSPPWISKNNCGTLRVRKCHLPCNVYCLSDW
nr:MAG TPA: hypothetical protein [Caudoviricetes sp.]